MNCAAIAALLPEYIRRRLPEAEMAVVRVHLSACATCAAAYEEELALGALLHGMDQPAPAAVLRQVMTSVRAEPRPVPAFRLRLLDLAFAVGLMVLVAGFTLGLSSLWIIVPVVTAGLDPGALLGGWTAGALAMIALWLLVGLSVSVPIAAILHTALGRGRRSMAGGA